MTALLTAKPQCVAPVGARLGEGPLWDSRTKRLLWVDIKGEKIFRLDPETRRTETIAAPGMVSALGLAEKGDYIAARRDGFCRLAIENGEVQFQPLADPEADLPGNRFNDGKVDPKGGFWAGTMDASERNITGSWYRLSPGGATVKLESGYHVTNGPAFDAARGRVYLTDSAAQTIFVGDSDGGGLKNKKSFLQFKPGEGYPDGMDVDRDGCLWVAFWDGACVRRFSPDALLLETVPLPVPRPTSVEIVGAVLYITSASVGLSKEQLEKAPLSGGLFEARLSRAMEDEAVFSFRG